MLPAIFLAVLLSGCGGDDKPGKDGQVVAKVNGDEVTVHQLNYELGLLGQAATKNTDQVARQSLEQLVNQQLIVQKAVTEKIDRDPRVMQALERAKHQVLVQAYMSKVAGRDSTPPSKQEVGDYYSKHPELFADRRIYQIREILLDKSIPAAELQAQIKSSKTLEEMMGWLEAKKVQMKSDVLVKSAEQLSPEMLSRLYRMRQGQVMAFEAPNNISLSILMAVRNQPLSEAQAAPAIENFLLNQKRGKLADDEVKRLRGEAKIEWLGKFAAKGDDKATPPAVNPGQENAAKHVADEKSNDADFIKKGVSGL
ncbi:MAG: EpsD family peptidyl-prolyl cis-trans isomerase [Gammaproteobacteria bacterium]